MVTEEAGGEQPPSSDDVPPSNERDYNLWLFRRCYGYYVLLGMSYHEYWECDPWLVKSYREAHELRREMTNQQLFLQGQYNYAALSAVIARALSDGKHTGELPSYPEYPFPITDREKEAEKKRKVRETMEWIAASQAAQKAREAQNTSEVNTNGNDG